MTNLRSDNDRVLLLESGSTGSLWHVLADGVRVLEISYYDERYNVHLPGNRVASVTRETDRGVAFAEARRYAIAALAGDEDAPEDREPMPPQPELF